MNRKTGIERKQYIEEQFPDMQLSDENKDMEIMVDYEYRVTVKLEEIPKWWGLDRYAENKNE